jgi:hypothetical protein
LQTVGHRVAERLRAEILRVLAGTELPGDTTFELVRPGRATSPFRNLAYRPLSERGAFALRLGSPGAGGCVESEVHVGLAEDRDARFTFCAVDHVMGRGSEAIAPMLLRLSDIHPELSRAAAERMAGWCTSLVDSRLSELGHQAETPPRP